MAERVGREEPEAFKASFVLCRRHKIFVWWRAQLMDLHPENMLCVCMNAVTFQVVVIGEETNIVIC
jgi:uncharacterized protein